MKLLRLVLENFMSYSNVDLDLTKFNSVLILGQNSNNYKENNGLGKSTIFKSIEYVLYNKSGAVLEKVVKDDCDKCSVLLEFEIHGEIYSIYRARSNKSNKSDLKLKQKIGDEWVSISAKTIPDTETELFKLIKIGYKAFQNSVHFSQHDLSALCASKSDQRKIILKDALQLFIYSKLEKIEQTRKTALQKEIDKLQSILSSLGDPQSEIDSLKIDLQIVEEKSLNEDVKIANLRSVQSIKKIKLSELEKNAINEKNDINEKLVVIKSTKWQLDQNLSQTKAQLIQIRKKIDELMQDKDQKNSSLIELEKKLNNIASQMVRDLTIVKTEFTTVVERETNGIHLIAEDEGLLKLLNSPMPDGEICTTCKQPITEEHRRACKQKTEEDVAKTREHLKKCKDVLINVQKKKKDLEAEITGINNYTVQVTSLNKDIQNKKDIILNNDKVIVEYTEILNKKKEELKQYEAQYSELITKELSLTESIKDVEKIDFVKQIENIKTEIDNIERQINLASRISSDLIGRRGALLEKITTKTETKTNLDNLKETYSVLQRKITVQNHVITAFSSIPTMIINTVLDDLQIEANNILNELRPGLLLQFIVDREKDGVVEETLDIDFIVGNKVREWGTISGGQRFFYSFALKLGLSKVIQNRLGVDIKFLLCDEIDQALDEGGVDALVESIHKLEDKYKIFLITHNPSVKNKFSNIILVEGVENNSTARLMTN